jgi:hypothetical protein
MNLYCVVGAFDGWFGWWVRGELTCRWRRSQQYTGRLNILATSKRICLTVAFFFALFFSSRLAFSVSEQPAELGCGSWI